ncbi:D-hexose-6-phosphate mutarotase [Pseudoalteromonas sp. MMG010]|uniref:D-hexose-6-phosphate mutarotase n=1 Tax=Pseudoalteromonas sp. MMG010 TaxID=2822685 RepID=UPI001B3A7AF4|nr:D-hexose-6-phosphate mutarotase [Pseudoalteromonas sp. MMG010]MBQ4834056.1 D-hexose-6-phosphate mutarotase [Pseudoalteromonas sp. MMG010]
MKLSPAVSIERLASGLEYINVESDLCSAKIFLQGAHISEFIPKGNKPLLWVSSDETFEQGTSIRGGIPVCWPWFGNHENSEFPAHGFARTSVWQADEVHESNNEISVSLKLPMRQVDTTLWPHQSSLKIEFVLSNTLTVHLTTTNLSAQAFSYTQALHSYFPTSAISDTQVEGLQGAQFIEFNEGPFKQNDVVTFARETDQVYTHAAPEQLIHTPEGIIKVGRENSTSCVLWNPWIDKAQRLSHFADDEYQYMVCLEAANVLSDTVTLEPKQSHTLTTTISWCK